MPMTTLFRSSESEAYRGEKATCTGDPVGKSCYDYISVLKSDVMFLPSSVSTHSHPSKNDVMSRSKVNMKRFRTAKLDSTHLAQP